VEQGAELERAGILTTKAQSSTKVLKKRAFHYVSQFEDNTYQIVDTVENREICVFQIMVIGKMAKNGQKRLQIC
jgi:hypothetical protein